YRRSSWRRPTSACHRSRIRSSCIRCSSRIRRLTPLLTVASYNIHGGVGGGADPATSIAGPRLREPREQLALLGAVRAVTEIKGPRVLVGDFNEWHRGPITRGLRCEFAASTFRARRTFPSRFPMFPLDRIYWDSDLVGEGFRPYRSPLA